ncbi:MULTISPECIES: SDR family oxidoreductase [Rhodococcus]|uniref:Possible dehydrogenase n=1 Tax=Rhodococcus jostii (strain RHA1) TaxID=101510 RepID=Q0SJD7_RHOJR|nr:MULTISPECIES: SDR family oxidoreductase [Rhodococcus]ABG92349.1 possible dehydrogenase [Rhodococcus jostii RHA1]
MLTPALAVDIGERGITVNAVAPAALDTDMNARWLRGDDHARATAASTTALRQLATPDDIACGRMFPARTTDFSLFRQVEEPTARRARPRAQRNDTRCGAGCRSRRLLRRQPDGCHAANPKLEPSTSYRTGSKCC